MRKKVILSLKGKPKETISVMDQGNENIENENIIELITEGSYHREGNTYFITYMESAVTGMDGTKTTLKISDNTLTILRFGTVNSQFVFKKGEKRLSHYDTINGFFTIGVFTRNLEIDINDSGGSICVDYSIEIDNNNTGDNNFHMLIREVGCNDEKYYGEN